MKETYDGAKLLIGVALVASLFTAAAGALWHTFISEETVLLAVAAVAAGWLISYIALPRLVADKMWVTMLRPYSRQEQAIKLDPAEFTARTENTNAGTVVKVYEPSHEYHPEDPAFMLSDGDAIRLADELYDTVGGESA